MDTRVAAHLEWAATRRGWTVGQLTNHVLLRWLTEFEQSAIGAGDRIVLLERVKGGAWEWGVETDPESTLPAGTVLVVADQLVSDGRFAVAGHDVDPPLTVYERGARWDFAGPAAPPGKQPG